MADAYKRLLAWAKQTHRDLNVKQAAGGWSIAVSINKPVKFGAYGTGQTLEDAAVEVIGQLEKVSSGALEEIGEEPSAFGIA